MSDTNRSGRIAVAASLSLLATGCLDDGLPDLQTGPTLTTLTSIVDDASPGGNGAVLRTCPIDDVDDLIDATFELVDDQALRDALDAELVATARIIEPSGQPMVECVRTDGEARAGIFVAAAPDDLDRYARVRTGDADVDVDESRRHRGGRFQHVCASNVDDGRATCEVDWIDDNVLIGAVLAGPGADELDTEAVEERFRLTVALVVEGFAIP